MSVRFGTNPIGWSNDDLPELGGEIPLEQCLREARAAGFAGIELGNKFPRAAAALRPLLAAHDLALVSGWYSGDLLRRTPEQEIAAMRPHLELLEALGCAVLIFAETGGAIHGARGRPLSARPKLSGAEMARLGERATAVAEHVRAAGLRLAYHHHMGTAVQSAADIDAFLAASGPAVELLLDTGHATFAGADPVALARAYGARIAHVHCKDVRAAVLQDALARDTSFLDAVVAGVFTVPGDGAVDFPAVLGVLAEAGYAGWLVVEAEQDPKKADPLTYARLGCANLRRLAAGAGFQAAGA